MDWELAILPAVLLISFIASIIIFVRNRHTMKPDDTVHGILNVDCSDPADGPYLYLELTVPITDVVDQKRVSFTVNVIPGTSQK